MTEATDHNRFMEMALAEAAKAPAHGDVPVGAVVVDSTGMVVASDHNRREERGIPPPMRRCWCWPRRLAERAPGVCWGTPST